MTGGKNSENENKPREKRTEQEYGLIASIHWNDFLVLDSLDLVQWSTASPEREVSWGSSLEPSKEHQRGQKLV